MSDFEKALNYLRDAITCGLSAEEVARRAKLLTEAKRTM